MKNGGGGRRKRVLVCRLIAAVHVMFSIRQVRGWAYIPAASRPPDTQGAGDSGGGAEGDEVTGGCGASVGDGGSCDGATAGATVILHHRRQESVGAVWMDVDVEARPASSRSSPRLDEMRLGNARTCRPLLPPTPAGARCARASEGAGRSDESGVRRGECPPCIRSARSQCAVSRRSCSRSLARVGPARHRPRAPL
jgi:hypothetical protein